MSEIIPLLVFTVFSGLAAGACIVSACFPGKDEEVRQPWALPLVCIVLLGIGLLGTLLHLGHPERFLNGLSNPTAMISQEAYWSIAFGVVLVVDFAFALAKKRRVKPIRIVASVLACGLLVVTSLAYFKSYGVPAWNSVVTFPLFILGGLALGSALWGVFSREGFIKGAFANAHIAVEALYACSIAALAVHFSGIGAGFVPSLFAGLVAGPALAAACAVAGRRGGGFAKIAPICALACVVIGTIIVRYAFYAANVL